MISQLIGLVVWLVIFSLQSTIAIIKASFLVLLFVAIYLIARTLIIVWGRRNKLPGQTNLAILITGATSGIGLEQAKFYHKLGFTVIGGYYNSAEPGYNELQQLNEDSRPVHLIQMDVTKLESIQEARKQVDVIFSNNKNLKLYCLINNAGISASVVPVYAESRQCIKKVCDTNLLGPLLVTREFMSLLVESQGRIVNVSSVLAQLPTGENLAVYGTTKAGLYYLSRCMSKETELYGVKTIVILPGNLIKNTNITNTILALKKKVAEELNGDEHLLYDRWLQILEKASIHEGEKIKRLREGDISVRAFQLVTMIDPDERAKKNADSGFITVGSFQIAKQTIIDCLDTLMGCVDSDLGFEESGVLEAFDDAVRQQNPIKVLFAGNRWFQFFTGPFQSTFPVPLKEWLLLMGKARRDRSVDDFLKSRATSRSKKVE